MNSLESTCCLVGSECTRESFSLTKIGMCHSKTEGEYINVSHAFSVIAPTSPLDFPIEICRQLDKENSKDRRETQTTLNRTSEANYLCKNYHSSVNQNSQCCVWYAGGK
jgi:hypothetical protein